MTDPRPKVSVIIPCYNLGAYVDQAVQSVLDQTYRDFEIIIIDDGSTDPITQNLFASYQRPFTRIFRTKNQGVMEARNLGIKESKGIYLSFLDADDLLEPSFLEKTVSALESDRDIAFASCWLRAFGASEFLWNPTSCNFPHLLAEDTVCTAALTRKDAIVAVGGFDTQMPLAGYEDWDLAINLVKHGYQGKIIPEYLFRYRIRHDSLSKKATEPQNHLLLMRYLIEKYPEIYKLHAAGILDTIETRIIELEESLNENQGLESPYLKQQNTFLKNTVNTVLNSRSWRITKPLRHGYRLAKFIREKITQAKISSPQLSVIVNCFNHDIQLQSAIYSLRNQLEPQDEIIVVDAGSSNPVTFQLLEWLQEAGVKIIKNNGRGLCQARKLGISHARAPVIFAMDCDQITEPSLFMEAIKCLKENRDASFVIFGIHDARTGFDWIPDSAGLPGILASTRVNFPIIRRDALLKAGGYDTTMDKTDRADWELIIRLVALGHEGILLPEPLVHRNPSSFTKDTTLHNQYRTQTNIQAVAKKHSDSFDMYWMESILGLENKRRLLQSHIENINSADQNTIASPAKTSTGQKAIILLYHRVEDVSRDRWKLCVSPQNFYKHLHFLKKHFIPVSLSELSSQIERGEIKDKSIVITFDDGYLDNLTNALPILNEFDFPATFFISGDGALHGKTFWWESLDTSAQLMDLDKETVRDLHHRLMSADIGERERTLASLHPPKNNLPASMTEADLKKLSQDRLTEIAAHGWSHRALSALSIEEQRIEVMENIKAIRDMIGLEVRAFSYPFGGFFTEDTQCLLREAGISVACAIGNGPVTKGSDPLALPRLDVENWDIVEFENHIWEFFDG